MECAGGRGAGLAWESCCYGAAFLYFDAPVLAAWRTALRHLLPLAVAAVFLAILYFALDGFAASRNSWAPRPRRGSR